MELAEDLIDALEAADKEHEFRMRDGAGHGLADTGWLDVALDLLARTL